MLKNNPLNVKSIFNTSDIIDDFTKFNKDLIVNDGYAGIDGTSNPYQFNLYSDLITNPSSVSISEFQKMVYTQPVIKMGLTTIFNLVKNEIGDYQHNNKKYEDFSNEMITKFVKPFDQIQDDILTGVWAGFSLGEQRYSVNNKGQRVVIDIEPRPASSIIFRIDSQGHLKDDGIIQYYFNNLWTGFGNLLAFNQVTPRGQQIPNPYASKGDFDYPWRTVWSQPIGTIIIPKNKCVHFVHKGLDGLTSPYGRSILRDIYDTYLISTEMMHITRSAAKFHSMPVPLITVDSNQINNPDGIDVMSEIAGQLNSLTENGYLLLQGLLDKSISVTQLANTVNLDTFVTLHKYLDQRQLTGLLYPSDLAGISDKGSYSLGKTQQDLLGRNISAIANSLKECIIHQVIKPMLQVNFNEQDDFGSFGNNDNVAEDISLNLDKINTLRYEGIKLKPEAIVSMLDIDKDAIESINNPILDTDVPPATNEGVNSNLTRAIRGKTKAKA